MGRKNVKIKAKLPCQYPSKKSNSNVSKISNKMDASRSMIDAKILPRVNVSLTRLIPTKMPDTAKEQYFNLIKSSDILTVIPNDKTTWDTLSPESTPEKEIERTSRNSNLLSQSTRTELQLSPVDLDTSCGDLSNEPWSEDNSEPYPSPKSPDVQENTDFHSLSESSDALKPWSFREQEINEWFCRYPIVACDNEVESIMALQSGKVSSDAATIPLQRPNPKKDVLQTMAIPLQPVGEASPFLVCRDDLPVFERSGIWTTPVSKMAEKEKSLEKEGTKRKRGRPRKGKRSGSSEVPPQNKTVAVNSDVSSRLRSSTPLCIHDAEKEKTQKGEKENSLDVTEQGNLEGIESQEGDPNSLGEHTPRSPRMLNEQTPLVINIESSSSEDSLDSSCEVITDQVVRDVEKKVKRKRGRPRKRRRLDSSDVPSQNKIVLVDSDVSSSVRSSTPLCTHDIGEENVKVGRKEDSSNVAEQENFAMEDKAESGEVSPYSRGEHTPQAPRMLNEQAPLVINIESSSSEGSIDLSCEAITDQVVRDVEKETKRKRGRPRKVRQLCSSDVPSQNKIVLVDSDVSSTVRSLTSLCPHDAEKEKVEKGEKECSSNVAEKESLEGTTEREGGSNSRVEHSPRSPRMLNEQTQLVINIESSSEDSLDSSCKVITEEVVKVVEDKQKTEPLVKKPEAKKWLSAVQIEVSPLIESLEMEGTKQGGKSPPRTTIFLQDHGEKCGFSKSNKPSNSQGSLDESLQQGRTKSTRQELFPSKYEQRKPSKDAAENESLVSGLLESSLSTTFTQDISSDSRDEEDKESVKSLEMFGKKNSPLRSLAVLCERLPVNKTNNHSCSDSLARNTSMLNENLNTRDDTAVLAQQEVSKRSSSAEPDCKAVESSPLLRNRGSPALCLSKKDVILAEQENQPYELLKGNVHIVPCSPIQNSKPTIFRNKSPTISPKISATSLLDGTVRLTPCRPLQTSRTPVEMKQRERNDRRSSVASTASSVPSPKRGNEMVAASNSFNSPVPLKNLVIKCDRLDANNYKTLKSPDNIHVIPGKRKRKPTKKNLENESNRKSQKQGGKGEKRKRKAKSNKNAKPPKRRNLGIPEHYKNLKPSQLSSISHTRMRYRVAFTFWPKKYSGALDRINQRLINQNAFWNSLD